MKRIIEIEESIYQGIINGKKADRSVEPREIVRSFQATIADAIAQSVPYDPSGDCISREALKMKAYTAVILEPDEKGIDYVKDKRYVVDLDDIDNAQRVQPKYSLLPLECTDMEDAFNRGYRAGKIEGILKANKRPQGEWKHIGGDEWVCSECGHVITTEGSWENPLSTGAYHCENCGADMRGGAK